MNLLLVLITVLGTHLTDAQQTALLDEAQNAYQLGVAKQQTNQFSAKKSFKKSADKFKLLTDAGIENGKLWYNQGNAYLQCGEVGEAIAAYRSAERFIPTDARLKANLAHARSLSGDSVQSKSTTSLIEQLAFWHRGLSTSAKIWLGLICWATLWTVLIVKQFAHAIAYKSVAVATAIASCALFSSVYFDFKHQQHTFGVIVTEEALVYTSHQSGSPLLFEKPLIEGQEFEIVNERTEWIRIQLPNGQTGWIQKENAQIVLGVCPQDKPLT
ncbi:MAG: hypothetical protein MK073_04100 [Phycisphaerales bacterium]|nr:hypothetical protein [Phycisphaerales bacterium]